MSTPALSTEPVLTITMTPGAVVFEGASNVYRYDRPGPAEVAHHVRSVLGAEPRGAVVHVVGDADEVDSLGRALAGYDITFTSEPAGGGEAEPSPTPSPEVRVARPGAREPNKSGRSAVDGWAVAAAVVVVSALAAGAIWASLGPRANPSPPIETEGGEAVTEPPSESTGASPAPPATPPSVVVERQGLRVELPAGFTVSPDGDMWRATGEDPGLRLQIAVEDLYGLPPEHMVVQVLEDIENDPDVELVSNNDGIVHYTQGNADGSVAHWKTWADGGHQLFVGCHTRFEATPVQKATCRMAMETAQYDPEAAG